MLPHDMPKAGPGVTITGMNLSTLVATIAKQAAHSTRHIVALAGPPAAGKSTVAQRLCKHLNDQGDSCAIVPMDGYHLDNTILEAKGLLARKGSPNTFDVDGFAHLVSRLQDTSSPIYLPVFDRQRDIAIAGATAIAPDCKVILVEGNYLALSSEPWNKLREQWDTTVFINPGLEVIEERILDRWIQHGMDFSDAIDRARDNDLPNAKTVINGYAAKPSDIHIDGPFDITS